MSQPEGHLSLVNSFTQLLQLTRLPHRMKRKPRQGWVSGGQVNILTRTVQMCMSLALCLNFNNISGPQGKLRVFIVSLCSSSQGDYSE